MRTVYHEHLTELAEQLSRLCGLSGATMERATRALLQADLASAEQVISDYDKIAAMGTRAEESAITLLALQQPVAGELRSIVSWIQAVADVDRMGALAVQCSQDRQTADIAPYVALLDAALADLKLTADERSELNAFAADLGLSAHHIHRAHRAFLDGLVEAALADGEVTDDEIDQLCRAAALLDLDVEFVTKHTDAYRTVRDTIALTPGLSVCFTGSATDRLGNEIERTELESLALRSGLVVKDSVTAKGCGLLVAADTSTGSGKADQARRFGIPVASVEDFLNSVGTAQSLPAIRLEATGMPLVCVSCGHSWIAKRRSREPRCETCK